MRYDIAIVGSGPAGLSAAINAKIRNKNIPIDIGIAPLSDFTIEDIKVPNDINISPSNNIPINTTFIFIIKFITSTYSGFTI